MAPRLVLSSMLEMLSCKVTALNAQPTVIFPREVSSHGCSLKNLSSVVECLALPSALRVTGMLTVSRLLMKGGFC